MALVRALHGRATMARVGAPWLAMGCSPERGETGKGRGEGARLGVRVGVPWRGYRRRDRNMAAPAVSLLYVLLVLGEEEEGKKREKKRRKEMENFLNLEIFRVEKYEIIYGLDIKIKDNFWSRSKKYFRTRKE
jgi:hypothetical protein